MAAVPDLHESFWIAIAAAAPIIGLASTVTADQLVRRNERVIEQAIRDHKELPDAQTGPFIIASCNILLQAGLLGLALYCLGNHYDSSPWRVIGLVAAVGGVLLVFLPTMWGLLSSFAVVTASPEAGAPDSPG